MFGLNGLLNPGLFSSIVNKQVIPGSMPNFGSAQNIQGIQPQYGAGVQHPSSSVGYHQTRPTQNTSALAPQGIHSFTPQGQQFANQQALEVQKAAQAAEQKKLADALKAQQEAEAAAQANEGGGYYQG